MSKGDVYSSLIAQPPWVGAEGPVGIVPTAGALTAPPVLQINKMQA